MPAVSEARLEALLAPFLAPAEGWLPVRLPPGIYSQLSTYLDLLLRWNGRTNLTAIREPEEMVRRHFGESLFAGTHLGPLLGDSRTLLDFGSGAGFPGLPIQLLLPQVKVTLAESQGKKAAFLREAVRVLGLATEVWSGRVEEMPLERLFDAVTLRAVDNMGAARKSAAFRVATNGHMAILEGPSATLLASAGSSKTFHLPEEGAGHLAIYSGDVPRGT